MLQLEETMKQMQTGHEKQLRKLEQARKEFLDHLREETRLKEETMKANTLRGQQERAFYDEYNQL